MKRIGLFILALIIILALSGVAAAFGVPGGDQANDKADASDKAKYMDDWELQPGRMPGPPPGLESITFIHWKDGCARPCDNDGVCDENENPSCADCKNNGGDEEPATSCYAFMGKYGPKYLKWPTLPVSYVINPTSSGLDYSVLESAVGAGAEVWDDEVTTELFNAPGLNYTAQYDVQNYVNAVVWGANLPTDVIAVTKVWWSPATKTIVEFDMKFNSTDFTWGDAESNQNLMDVQNIAAHEFGHAAGLADVYDTTSCGDVTMYGYSTEGETIKRTLEAADITGIQTLYP